MPSSVHAASRGNVAIARLKPDLLMNRWPYVVCSLLLLLYTEPPSFAQTFVTYVCVSLLKELGLLTLSPSCVNCGNRQAFFPSHSIYSKLLFVGGNSLEFLCCGRCLLFAIVCLSFLGSLSSFHTVFRFSFDLLSTFYLSSFLNFISTRPTCIIFTRPTCKYISREDKFQTSLHVLAGRFLEFGFDLSWWRRFQWWAR